MQDSKFVLIDLRVVSGNQFEFMITCSIDIFLLICLWDFFAYPVHLEADAKKPADHEIGWFF